MAFHNRRLGENLRRIRLNAHMTQKALTEQIGYQSPEHWSRIEPFGIGAGDRVRLPAYPLAHARPVLQTPGRILRRSPPWCDGGAHPQRRGARVDQEL